MEPLQSQTEPAILRRKQVEVRTGLSRSTIYEYMQAGTFPSAVALGPRAVGWVASEVNAWIAGRTHIYPSAEKK